MTSVGLQGNSELTLIVWDCSSLTRPVSIPATSASATARTRSTIVSCWDQMLTEPSPDGFARKSTAPASSASNVASALRVVCELMTSIGIGFSAITCSITSWPVRPGI